MMNEVSVSSVNIPSGRIQWRGDTLYRRAVLKMLKQIGVGSLALRDGDELMQFGDAQGAGPHAQVVIHDVNAYRYLLSGGNVGAGESYMLRYWSTPDLTAVIRLFCANMAVLQSVDSSRSFWRRIALKILHTLNGNSLSGSRRNISAHYDLGNDFFKLFLDSGMMYSSAVFPTREACLEEASVHKLDIICRQLELSPEDHLLEIGTGWGAMAIYAAKNYGCCVTTTTLSREQYDYARQRVAAEGLEDRITLLCEDYRSLEGEYDKLVSIEMIEAVGFEYYQTYFRRCSSLLKPDGIMVIQAITMADQRYDQARTAVDFIKRYIFPGGCLPSVEVISRHVAQDTDMQIIHLRDITQDYARTLSLWRERFIAALPAVREQGFDSVFERMWEFYLCYCEGGFRERVIGTVQLKLAKPGYRFSEA